jgi:hypothetical protein
VSRCARMALLAALALLCGLPASARAELAFEPAGTTLQLLNVAGEPETRAGAHPDRMIQGFKLVDTGGEPERMKQQVIELPPGLGGSLDAVPLCPRPKVMTLLGDCPAGSRVGTMTIFTEQVPVYSVQPGPNEAATFAIVLFFGPVMMTGRLRPADQGLSLYLNEIEDPPFVSGITEGQLELWGVPADHQTGTSIPRRALLTTPTRCDLPPLAARLSVRTWEHPDRWFFGSADTGQKLTGCEDLSFAPELGFVLDEHRADAPSGARIDLMTPQERDPDRRATSLVKDVEIAMPAGLTVSPGGATALTACGDAQFGLGTAEDAACPPSSRVGSVEIEMTGLERPVNGAIYLGEEHPNDRFRVLIAARAVGTTMKFAGSLRADPRSGRLTTTMRDLPQIAFDRMSLRFDGGPGALLATPLTCGPAPTSAQFVPYSGSSPVERHGFVSVAAPAGGDCSGPAPFSPSFAGGSTSARPGRPTSFTTTIRRRDGEQLPRQLALTLPPGLSAALGKVPLCPAQQAREGSCPSGSRIGSAVAELGPGDRPATLHGDVHLTGAYRGAPFGVALALDGQVGPFRLGTLTVRGAVRIDPLSGRVTVEMDPLPTIFEGVPIRFQTIGLDLDRPGLMRNPTSCLPSRAVATLHSESGALATPASRFAMRGCVDLPFRPRFSIALDGEKELRKGGKPALGMSLRMRPGGANLRSVEVQLPRLLKLDPSGPRALCARRRALEGDCPANARIGVATARTPLLEQPMEGSLYVVQPKGDGSPDLWVALAGQGLEVNLRGEIGFEERRIETRFSRLPDFPLESLRLRLEGGEQGIFRLTKSPCGRLQAPVEIAGQNGVRRELRAPVERRSRCGTDG